MEMKAGNSGSPSDYDWSPLVVHEGDRADADQNEIGLIPILNFRVENGGSLGASLLSKSVRFTFKKAPLSAWPTPILQSNVAGSISCVGPTRCSTCSSTDWFGGVSVFRSYPNAISSEQ